MMCVVSAAGSANEPATGSIAQALLIYLVIYAVMNLGAFAVVAVVIRQSGEQLGRFRRAWPGITGAGRSDALLPDQFDRFAAVCGVWREGECALGAGAAGGLCREWRWWRSSC
jgi:hypothetical protein